MSADEQLVRKLIERVEQQEEALVKLTNVLSAQSPQSLPQPTIQVVHSPPQVTSPGHNPGHLQHDLALASYFDTETSRTSIFTEEESDDEVEEAFHVDQPLAAASFTEQDFRDHLKSHRWDEEAQKILDNVLHDRDLRNAVEMFKDDEDDVTWSSSDNNLASIYDIGSDGEALRHRLASKDLQHAIWLSLSRINAASPTPRRIASGRITILREPSPLLFGALHLTMSQHFDMDAIFRFLCDESTTRAYMKGCFEPEPTKQRSFVFSFKYHTIIHPERDPMPWQAYEPDHRDEKMRIPISTCSSIVALSLSGTPIKTLRNRSRRRNAHEGKVFDPFGSWHVLSIQCFPDWKSTVDTHEGNRNYVNGPEAFLVTVLDEFRDAQKRFFEIAKRVSAMISPPQNFLFDPETRDALLFEDDDYTYSRRYFWATQTLAVMNNNIQSMIKAYQDTFTDQVWNGEHKYIWPGKIEQSKKYENWRARMVKLRKLFEIEINKLEDIMDVNTQEMKDIKALRDQLFSGTSVRESREALRQAEITVQQNRNIRLLTLFTIFFLPLTFVTSVFGMTNMPDRDGFVPFVVATAAVCFPTYVLIGILNTPSRVNRLKSIFRNIFGRKARESSHRNHPQRARNEIGYGRSFHLPYVTSSPGVTSPSAYARRPPVGSEGNGHARQSSLSPPPVRSGREPSVKFDIGAKSRHSTSQDAPVATKFEHAPLSPQSPTEMAGDEFQPLSSDIFLRLSRVIRGKDRPGLPV